MYTTIKKVEIKKRYAYITFNSGTILKFKKRDISMQIDISYNQCVNFSFGEIADKKPIVYSKT